ncbi:MAG: complex I subunit 5 family protein [Candidatus Heimdallarchaeaceae archaeon]
MDLILSLILIVPLAGAGLLALFEQFKDFIKKMKISPDCLSHIVANLIAIATVTLAILSIFINDLQGLNSTADNLLQYGLLEAILISIFAFLVWMAVIFSVDYVKGKNAIGYYYALVFTLLSGLSAVVMASNYFTLFIGWELFGLSGYALVAFDRMKRGAVEASLKYFLMSTVGSMFILLATALTYGFYGTVSFEDLRWTNSQGPITGLIVALYIVGFGVTAAIILLNAWLPDAHSNAPSTISALLSGIVVKAGAFGMYRTLFWAFNGLANNMLSNTSVLVSWLGILTMIDGNFLVFAQFRREDIIDLKRILAYSTTVHLGYVILGIGTGTSFGLASGFLHLITHALGKGMLFLLSGVLIGYCGSRDIRDMQGIGRKRPFIGVILTIGLLSLGGIPITGGFVSKLLIILATLNGYHSYAMNIALVIFAVTNSVLALGGYLYIIKYIVFDEPKVKGDAEKRISVFQATPLIIMAVIIILLGIWPGKLFELIQLAVNALNI